MYWIVAYKGMSWFALLGTILAGAVAYVRRSVCATSGMSGACQINVNAYNATTTKTV